MAKLLIGILLFLFILFVVASAWLSYKNDASSEMQEILLKAAGAIAIASFLMFNEFYLKKTHLYSSAIPIPLVQNFKTNEIFAPFRVKASHLPQEGNFFKGLQRFNMEKLFLSQRDIPLPDDLEDLALLEYVFFKWLAQDVGFQFNESSIVFSHAGHSGSMSLSDSKIKRIKNVNLATIQNPNRYVQEDPFEIALPAGASVIRSVQNNLISITIRTDTGKFSFDFMPGGGGLFQAVLPSPLIQSFSNEIRAMYDVGPEVSLEDQFTVRYPILKLTYQSHSLTKFSIQSQYENEWFQKINRNAYKDFSWDLLREYFSFGFQQSLELYRNHPSNSLKADH